MVRKENMKTRAPRNRTLSCTCDELSVLDTKLLRLSAPVDAEFLTDRIINQDFAGTLHFLPAAFVDLLILDPPYNLTKNYNGHIFRSQDADQYTAWFDTVISSLIPLLRPMASVYVCSDWQTSTLVFPVLDKYLHVRNRITWEREKGRGAKANWKNNTEDIWYCTLSEDYYFNVDSVKLKRRVIAPTQRLGRITEWQLQAYIPVESLV
jgi:site-specific DNA-methyltransferase (adenine-specific)